MPKDMPRFSNRHLRATISALFAVGCAIPTKGIGLLDLQVTLAPHLEQAVYDGIIRELERLKIIQVDRGQLIIHRGPEYSDGLERLRLRGEELKKDRLLINRHPEA